MNGAMLPIAVAVIVGAIAFVYFYAFPTSQVPSTQEETPAPVLDAKAEKALAKAKRQIERREKDKMVAMERKRIHDAAQKAAEETEMKKRAEKKATAAAGKKACPAGASGSSVCDTTPHGIIAQLDKAGFLYALVACGQVGESKVCL
jgi:hypothetical protein